MSVCVGSGNFCNQLIRHVAVSIIACKFNLNVRYAMPPDSANWWPPLSLVELNECINELGIDRFNGKNIHNDTKELNDSNYRDILEESSINYNLVTHPDSFFQSTDIINIIHKHLNEENNKNKIIKKNPFKERYNNNNDVFIHCRLGDTNAFYPGIKYIVKCINKIENFDKIYVASMDFDNAEIKELKDKYPNIIFIDKPRVETIQFGNTCKHIILSDATFSLTIGLLAYFSNIYCPKDMGSWGGGWKITGWNRM